VDLKKGKRNPGAAPKRLAKEDLRASRLGLLGRFPAEDLYEPEACCSPTLKAARTDVDTHAANGATRKTA